MPVMGSHVSLSWPDYTYMSVRSEDGDDWVVIHHSLTNCRESHMTTVTAMDGSLEVLDTRAWGSFTAPPPFEVKVVPDG